MQSTETWVDPDVKYSKFQSRYYKYDKWIKENYANNLTMENLKREMETKKEPKGNSKCEKYKTEMKKKKNH